MLSCTRRLFAVCRHHHRRRHVSSDSQRHAYEHYYKKSSRSSTSSRNVHDANVQMAWYALAAVVGALGATYASVPLYKLFCQVTGFGGTTQRVELKDWAANSHEREETGISQVLQKLRSTVSSTSRSTGTRVHTWTDEEAAQRLASLKPVENGRLITVRFDSTVGDVLPWTFEPVQLDVKVVPGETALSFFRVSNLSDKPITGVATYNVHPPKAGLYFSKIQCFCFEEQRLLPGETVDMPVFFFIDPEFQEDPQLTHVHNITLSYTFFQTDVEEGDGDEWICFAFTIAWDYKKQTVMILEEWRLFYFPRFIVARHVRVRRGHVRLSSCSKNLDLRRILVSYVLRSQSMHRYIQSFESTPFVHMKQWSSRLSEFLDYNDLMNDVLYSVLISP